ncbi:unnamed protein product [Zymoseptoria tritici ST99CH_1A5]|uniref:Uncharacterized protein n=1 Tax=Zymoseptoria tritici ST99CH_1A5 TaxID=1276529 RepID=A0A1Y6LQE6_ZYMTR|nr:unnamed protein product [Zymoseptoria tritici ST99CH_1A5]
MRQTLRPLPPAYVRGTHSGSPSPHPATETSSRPQVPEPIDPTYDYDSDSDDDPPSYSRYSSLASSAAVASRTPQAATSLMASTAVPLPAINEGEALPTSTVSAASRSWFFTPSYPSPEFQPPPASVQNDPIEIHSTSTQRYVHFASPLSASKEEAPSIAATTSADLEAQRKSRNPKRRRFRCCGCGGKVSWNFVLFWVVVIGVSAGVAWSETRPAGEYHGR